MVKGFSSDQALTEKKLADCPYGPLTLGRADHDEVKRRLAALADGSAKLDDPSNKDLAFLPNALELPGHQHIQNNALQEAIESVPEWQELEPYVKAWAFVLADRQTKAVVIEMSRAKRQDSYARQLIHQCSQRVLEWRWGELLVVLWYIVHLYAYVEEYWDPTLFTSLTDPIKKAYSLFVLKCCAKSVDPEM